MKKINLIFVILVTLFLACKKEGDFIEETVTTGKTKVYVDETLLPIVEEQVMVFESTYKYAKIDLVEKPESELINLFLKQEAKIIILPRELTFDEKSNLEKRNFIGKTTPVAIDAIALIINSSESLEKITSQEIFDILKGKKTTKQLVFDNANSSTLNYLKKLAGVKNIKNSSVTALKNNNEVITFVSENKNCIGFVGVNWILNPTIDMESILTNVKVLAVGNSIDKAVKPSQSNISSNKYPFVRKLYLLNFQGKAGLGMGFASFFAGDVGQRIILKSGLVPYSVPTREIKIRKKI
jgi:phosphate transport system substrate-binding protein